MPMQPMRVRKSVMTPFIKDDGFLDFKHEATEDEVTMVSLLKGKFKELSKQIKP